MNGRSHPAVRTGLYIPGPHAIEVCVSTAVLATHPSRLMTPALGSCIGITLWDPSLRTGVLAHVMLPAPGDGTQGTTVKYVEFAVPEMVRMMVEAGSFKHRLVAKIAGGAAMFCRESLVSSIGQRNVEEARRQLALAQVRLAGEDTGQAHARTIELALDTGIVMVHSHRYGVREL